MDREEEQLIEGLNQEGQEAYLENRDNVWGGQFNRYTNLLRSSLKYDKNNSSDWDVMMADWEKNINREITKRENQIKDSQGNKYHQLERELTERLRKRSNLINQTKHSNYKKIEQATNP